MKDPSTFFTLLESVGYDKLLLLDRIPSSQPAFTVTGVKVHDEVKVQLRTFSAEGGTTTIWLVQRSSF